MLEIKSRFMSTNSGDKNRDGGNSQSSSTWEAETHNSRLHREKLSQKNQEKTQTFYIAQYFLSLSVTWHKTEKIRHGSLRF